MRNKPNFLYIGPSKSGSTWIYDALRRHPQVFLTTTKELHYFDFYHHLGPEWYYKHFNDVKPEHKLIGEFSPDYLYFPEAVERIAEELGSPKMLSCLRDPVDRAYSEYLYVVKLGFARGSFAQVLEKCPEVATHSMYGRQLVAYRDRMPCSRLIIVDFARIKAEPDKLFLELCERLEIDPMVPEGFNRAKIHGASAPRNFFVAKTAKKISNAILYRGGGSFINKVKGISLVQKFLYRPYTKSEKTDEDRATAESLRERFGEDVALLDKEFGTNYSELWGYKQPATATAKKQTS